MGRRNGSSGRPKHGNPGYSATKLTKQRNNQAARDAARNRGREARDEVEYIKHRLRFLSSLHRTARKIVAESGLMATLSVRTSHLTLEEFCAYVDDLTDRLFKLELRIVHQVRSDFWHGDQRLIGLGRAIELRERAEYMRDDTLEFQLNRMGISISIPGGSCNFYLDQDGLQACSDFMFAYEKVSRHRRLLSTYH